MAVTIKSNNFNFGRAGNTRVTRINNEFFRAITHIQGWKHANDKVVAVGNEQLLPGRGNYIRTCLEHAFPANTASNRANFFPYCLSSDKNIEQVPVAARKWNPLPVNDKGQVGIQQYICPKNASSDWSNPETYYCLTETASNSAWPTRPSNGNNPTLVPPKPYHARIRIPLNDLRWQHNNQDFSILNNGSADETVELTNGTKVQVTKVRGYINLINPNGSNSSISGPNPWPHNFNQIFYRVTEDEFGGDDSVPLITVLDAECAGTSSVNGRPINAGSSYYGDGIVFEVPVLENQNYLIFDVYTDICSAVEYQLASNTIWWQMTWSFESCMYRDVDSAADDRMFHIEHNPDLRAIRLDNQSGIGYWPRENYQYVWTIVHNMDTTNIDMSLYDDIGDINSVYNGRKIMADFEILDRNRIAVYMRAIPRRNGTYPIIPANSLRAIVIASREAEVQITV